MKLLAAFAAGTALALAAAPALAISPSERAEAKLARMLEGRVAGQPEQCINAMRSNHIEVIEHVGLVYDAGETIWVARVTDPRMLDHWDVPVIRRFGSQLCSNDSIRTVDRSSGFTTGVLFLEDFVPYRRNG